jgi:hypothetical protein
LLIVDQRAQRGTERQFIVTGSFYMSTQAKDTGAFAFLCANGGIPIGAVINDSWNSRERLTIVDDGRAAVETNCAGKGFRRG